MSYLLISSYRGRLYSLSGSLVLLPLFLAPGLVISSYRCSPGTARRPDLPSTHPAESKEENLMITSCLTVTLFFHNCASEKEKQRFEVIKRKWHLCEGKINVRFTSNSKFYPDYKDIKGDCSPNVCLYLSYLTHNLEGSFHIWRLHIGKEEKQTKCSSPNTGSRLWRPE